MSSLLAESLFAGQFGEQFEESVMSLINQCFEINKNNLIGLNDFFEEF